MSNLKVRGNASGTGTVTFQSGNTSSNYTITLPNATDTVAVLGIPQTFTGNQTFQAASTQDGIVLAGRAGGTSSYAITLTPATLSSSTTLTLPNVTDTVAVLGTAQTFTAQQTFTGSSSSAGAKLIATLEKVTVSATAATGTINYDVTTQAILYYTTNSSGNFVVNLRGSSGTTLNALLAIGDAVTVAFLVTNGSPAYYNTSVQVDGTTSGVTTRWQGGTAPSAGNASSVDIYSYTVIKTANATFSVFGSQTKFA